MCGRFVQAQNAQSYADYFGATLAVPEELDPSWNVAPTDQVYAVAEHEGERHLGTFRWGLVPWFADSLKIGARHINARSETVHTSRVFQDSFQRKRCLIPADGFFEWEKLESGDKLPHYIHSRDGAPLALAGIWASWRDPEGERITSCSILTTKPNALVAPIHDRMPVALARDSWSPWLDRDNDDVDSIRRLLVTPEAESMVEHTVSTLVNKVANNYPEVVSPLR
jgi:putative SOS response-associated peptidase YedK